MTIVRNRRVGRAGPLAAAVALVLVASPAAAEDPVTLDPGPITDRAGVLDAAGRADAVAAIGKLKSEDGVDLFVVFVDSFDGIPSQQWTDQTAQRNGLGLNDALLAVAVGDRQYAWSVDESFPLSDDELADINADLVEPRLADEDWSGAAVAEADGMRAEIGGDGGSSRGWLWLVLLLGVLAVAGFLVWRAVQRRRPPAAPPGPVNPLDALSDDELAVQGGAMLVELDDALKTSELALDLATAEYGEAETARYREALAAAKLDVNEAFLLKAGVDGLPPGPERRARLVEIFERCQRADAALDAQADAFDALRDLAKRAPEMLTALGTQVTAAEARLPEVEAALAALAAANPVSALGDVADNATEIRERLAFARTAVQTGQQQLAANDTAKAALAVRGAQEALEQVAILDRAVTDLGPALAEARAGLRARVVSLQQDLADVERLGVAGDPAVATAAAGARAAVVSVDGHYDDVALDPHAAGANLARAEEALDAALGPAREQQARVDKARATLPAELGAAESRIRSIDDFITTRRGAVGPSARTDLAEARRLVQEARRVAETDPVAALTTAKEAGDLAARASTQAQADVRDYQRAPYGGTAGSGGGGFNLGALVMSGILLDQMTRGGRGGGYRGGSRSGSGWSGGARPGGFGGSGRRRGGGGRF